MRTQELISLRNWGPAPTVFSEQGACDAIVDCGWGRVLFGQTFASAEQLADALRDEDEGHRDVALYIRNPQVVLAQAPQELFIDPSLTLRLSLLDALPDAPEPAGIRIRPLSGLDELREVNRIYMGRGMVPLDERILDALDARNDVIVLVACEEATNRIVGSVQGIDHSLAFGDPDNGSSLWALAADAQQAIPGLGTALVLALASRFRDRGRSLLDLSVMHDNTEAIQLYEQLGFEQVPVYCIKNRNAINEPLYTGPREDVELNPYAQIITDEAYRRGISVEVEDAAEGMFRLSLGGRVVHCRESLTDATSGVAVARCDDKSLTHRLLQQAGLCVPAQTELDSEAAALAFLAEHGSIVIKPARGEQGRGVAVGLQTEQQVLDAYRAIANPGDTVLAEEFIEGQDLRIVVINDEVVAAAIRKPAEIIGTGRHTIETLIEKQSRRRQAATGGESCIPVDEETHRCLAEAGFDMQTVLPAGMELAVRKTANLHTGGTLHDVTYMLCPRLKAAALRAAHALDIPVVGLDLMVRSAESPFYRIIEANERPGLANHEPQPTAVKLLDFLFPNTISHEEQSA
jgi:GNAT-family acetyltransferase (TIGR03103 family)